MSAAAPPPDLAAAPAAPAAPAASASASASASAPAPAPAVGSTAQPAPASGAPLSPQLPQALGAKPYSEADLNAYFKRAKAEGERQAGESPREREARLKNPGAIERTADTVEFATPARWKGSAEYAKGRKALNAIAETGLGLPMAILALLLAFATRNKKGEYEKAAEQIRGELPDTKNSVGFTINKNGISSGSCTLDFYRIDPNGEKKPLGSSDNDQAEKKAIMESIWRRAGYKDEMGRPIAYTAIVGTPSVAASATFGPSPTPSAPAASATLSATSAVTPGPNASSTLTNQ